MWKTRSYPFLQQLICILQGGLSWFVKVILLSISTTCNDILFSQKIYKQNNNAMYRNLKEYFFSTNRMKEIQTWQNSQLLERLYKKKEITISTHPPTHIVGYLSYGDTYLWDHIYCISEYIFLLSPLNIHLVVVKSLLCLLLVVKSLLCLLLFMSQWTDLV